MLTRSTSFAVVCLSLGCCLRLTTAYMRGRDELPREAVKSQRLLSNGVFDFFGYHNEEWVLASYQCASE